MRIMILMLFRQLIFSLYNTFDDESCDRYALSTTDDFFMNLKQWKLYGDALLTTDNYILKTETLMLSGLLKCLI